MTLEFHEMHPLFREQKIWGAVKGNFSFVITMDLLEGRYTASAKTLDAVPHDGNRIDLGGFNAHHSMMSAQRACEDFYKKHNN